MFQDHDPGEVRNRKCWSQTHCEWGERRKSVMVCIHRLVAAHVAKGKHMGLWGSGDLCEPKFLSFPKHKLSEEKLEEELMEIKQANEEPVGSARSQRLLTRNVIKLVPTKGSALEQCQEKGFFFRWNKCRCPPRKLTTFICITIEFSSWPLAPKGF